MSKFFFSYDYIGENCGLIYDQKDKIPFDRIEKFLTDNLK